MYFFLLSFPILGAGIKYIDDAFDEKTYSKTLAFVLAPLLGILWAYTMLIDVVAATILLAILCGVLLKGKIDNYAHLVGLMVIIGIAVVGGMRFMLAPLFALTIAVLLDEVGNDLVDKKKDAFNMKLVSNRVAVSFFDQRWFMKLTILCFVFIGIVSFYFFIAIVLFDYAYLLVRWYGRSRHDMPVTRDSWSAPHMLRVPSLFIFTPTQRSKSSFDRPAVSKQPRVCLEMNGVRM